MSEKELSQAGNIESFQINSNTGGGSVDLSAGVVEYNYYESVLSNTISASATIVETGNDSSGSARGSLDGLPIRGGERAQIKISDNQGGTLEVPLYVNRARDAIPGTQQDLYVLDFASREYFANTQTRVTKRYEGKISDHVSSILGDVLPVSGGVDVDDNMMTSVPGVWAIGDIRNTPFKQAVVACSDGCIAAMSIDKYLNSRTEFRVDWVHK